MDNRKHTAAPWRDAGQVGLASWIVGADGKQVATVYGPNVNRASEANARLITAAPELLEACIAALDEDCGLACAPQLRAAIAKATKEHP